MMGRALHTCSVILWVISGSVAFAEGQATPFAMPAQLKELNPSAVVDPDPAKSYFTMVRLHAEADCAWLVEHYGEFLPVPNM